MVQKLILRGKIEKVLLITAEILHLTLGHTLKIDQISLALKTLAYLVPLKYGRGGPTVKIDSDNLQH